MPLPKLKNSLSVKLALDSVLQIRKLVFQLWQLHPKKSKTVSETCSKQSQFGAVSETRGLASWLVCEQSLKYNNIILFQFSFSENAFIISLEMIVILPSKDGIQVFVIADINHSTLSPFFHSQKHSNSISLSLSLLSANPSALEIIFENRLLSRPLFSFFLLFNTVDGNQKFNINFADDWIQTANLLYWKRSPYQLSHNHCSSR